MKNIIVFLLFTLCGLSTAFAQTPYESREGHILISGKYEGIPVLVESHQLFLFLDYTTKEFKGNLDLSTLDTGIDSLNSILASLKPAKVYFSGFIPNDDFIDWEHLELEFNIPLTVLLLGESLYPSLNIKLNHSSDSRNYACFLSGVMDLDISEFDNKIEDLGDTIEVKFTQVLMRRDRN